MWLNMGLTLLFASGAVASDLYCRRIPNWLTLTAAFVGFGIHGILLGRALDSVMGGLFGILALVIPFLLGGIGAGDMKLLAAIGLAIGAVPTITAALVMAVAGGVCAVLLKWDVAHARDWLGTPLREVLQAKKRGISHPGLPVSIPYGVPIFFGVLYVVLLQQVVVS